MKKTLLFLPLCAAFLVGCATGSNGDSSNSSEIDSSSDSTSESSKTDAEQFAELGAKLRSLEGNIQKKNTSLTRTFVYPSDGYFGIVVESEDVTTKYTRGDTYLVDSLGSEIYNPDDSEENEPLSYHAQIFDNGKKFYSIKEYEDGTNRSQKSITFNELSVSLIYDIGFAQTEIDNFDAILGYKENYPDLFEYTFENIEGKIEGDKLTYSYSISNYVEEEDDEGSVTERCLTTRISYTNVYTIKDGLVTHLSQTYLSEVFAGDIASTVEALSEVDYIQGTYEEYAGEVLATTKKDTD